MLDSLDTLLTFHSFPAWNITADFNAVSPRRHGRPFMGGRPLIRHLVTEITDVSNRVKHYIHLAQSQVLYGDLFISRFMKEAGKMWVKTWRGSSLRFVGPHSAI